MKVLPIFKSNYSLGRSILTLEKAGNSTPSEPDSIIDLALAHKLERVFIVDNAMTGYLEAETNCNASKLPLTFGVRLTFVPDMTERGEATLEKSSKYIIFIKAKDGYKRMIEIWTAATQNGFYYE